MMRFLTLLLFFIFCTTVVFGQAEVTGQVVDAETGKPLEFTTVSLLLPQDSALVTGGFTDNDGNFNIAAEPGRYIVQIQYVSYETQVMDAIQVGAGTKNLGKISLTPSTATLSEVVVEGQRDQAILELDKRVFNVGENVSNAARNASEILDNLPSVSVDVEGNVSLRGSGSVRVLVDGKPSGIIGIGDTEGLRNLAGDMIERIEVITNPSARYDAQGSAGIINIVLKKKQNVGLNGSFTANAGHPTNYGGSVNLNYRRDWVNFFVNYGVNYRRSPGTGTSYREFFQGDSSYYTLQDQNRTRGGISHNFRVGSDFIINDYNTITASLLYNVSDQNNTSNIWYNDYTMSNQLLDRILRMDEEAEDEQNQEYELYYKRSFSQKGRELTATVQYRESGELENSDIVEYEGITEQEANLFQRVSNDEMESQWLLQADYVHPFLKDGRFEIGTRNTLRQIGNDYLVEELGEGVWESLDQFSNDFRYTENIYAGYVIVGNKTGKWSYQGGLRLEATDITTHLLTTDEKNDKRYINLFPSAALTYSFQQGRSFQASYSRRLNRPGFRMLNPFSTFSDSRNIRTGNPDLDPEFTDSYEVGYLHNFSSGNIYAGTYYRHSEGEFERVTFPGEDGILYTRPENLSTENAYGIEVNGNLDLFSWWNVNANFNFYRAMSEGVVTGERLNGDTLYLSNDTYTASGRFNSRWKIPNLFELQMNTFYRAPQETTQGRRKAFYSVDLGMNRDILNKKASILLSVQDLFNTRKFRFETFGEDFYENSEFQWRKGPQVTVTFTYRLNQMMNGRDRDQRGGRGDNGGDGGGMDEGGEF